MGIVPAWSGSSHCSWYFVINGARTRFMTKKNHPSHQRNFPGRSRRSGADKNRPPEDYHKKYIYHRNLEGNPWYRRISSEP